MGLRGLRGLGQADGRRSYPDKLVSNLGQLPWTQAQKATLDAKAFAVQTAAPFLHPSLNFFNPPADSDYFTVTPNPFPNYPTVGASAIAVISLQVPPAKIAVIRKLAIVHFGGNPPDGTGRVIWRVIRNGGGLRGLGTLTAQYGTFAAPKDASIFCYEYDTLTVTVECPKFLPDGVTPNPGPPAGSTTGASFDGFFYPLSEATSPTQGSY
jgi:hypothetical protein